MGTSKTTFSFEELRNFVQNQLWSLLTAKNTGFYTMDFEKSGIHSFSVYLNFICRRCFPLSIHNTGKILFVEVSF